MKRLLVGLLPVVILLAAGCDSSSETDTYSVTLSDEDGAPVFGGELRLRIDAEDADDGTRMVTGSWQLRGRDGHADPVPDAGALDGRLQGNSILLGLDMGAINAGIGLGGTYDGDRITGEWNTITIAGPMPGGTFEAIRD